MTWETRTVPFELKSWGEDEDFYTFDGYMSLFHVEDRVEDKTAPGAFKRTIDHHKGRFPLKYGHQPGFADLLGGAILSEDTSGGFVKGSLPKAVAGNPIESSLRAFAFLKMGVLDGMSYSYKAIKKSYEGNVRILKEVAVGEITLASKSEVAMPETTVNNVKGFHDPDFIERVNEIFSDEIKALRDRPGPGTIEDDSALHQDSALSLQERKLIEIFEEVCDGRGREKRIGGET